MSEKFLFGVLIFFCGMFCIVGAVGNYEWFFNISKVSSLVDLVGRNITRIIYTFVGIIGIIMGITLMMGMNL
jgi:hypothetical protein